MKIAVVILNWNGQKLLKEFLPSVIRYSEDATLYVADNNSTDDSIPLLKKQFPTVQIIENTENGGYAKGYNQALASVKEDIYVLLNNDVAVSENWLKPIRQQFIQNPKLVAAQPKILDYTNRHYFEYAGAAGGFIDRLGYPYCRGRVFNTIERDEGQYDTNCTIFWATGAALFVRKSSFWEVDGFDEDLFAHQEEIDLCWRLQSRGGQIMYVGNSKVFHLGGGTLTASNPKKTYYNFRNTLLILLKNAGGTSVYWRIFQRLLWDAVAGIHFLSQGKANHFLAIIQAHFGFYKRFPSYLRKRKKWSNRTKYWRVKSAVYSYFIQKKRTFNRL